MDVFAPETNKYSNIVVPEMCTNSINNNNNLFPLKHTKTSLKFELDFDTAGPGDGPVSHQPQLEAVHLLPPAGTADSNNCSEKDNNHQNVYSTTISKLILRSTIYYKITRLQYKADPVYKSARFCPGIFIAKSAIYFPIIVFI